MGIGKAGPARPDTSASKPAKDESAHRKIQEHAVSSFVPACSVLSSIANAICRSRPEDHRCSNSTDKVKAWKQKMIPASVRSTRRRTWLAAAVSLPHRNGKCLTRPRASRASSQEDHISERRIREEESMELQPQDRLRPRSHASLRSASNMSLSPELLRVVCPYPEQGQQNAAPGLLFWTSRLCMHMHLIPHPHAVLGTEELVFCLLGRSTDCHQVGYIEFF